MGKQVGSRRGFIRMFDSEHTIPKRIEQVNGWHRIIDYF